MTPHVGYYQQGGLQHAPFPSWFSHSIDVSETMITLTKHACKKNRLILIPSMSIFENLLYVNEHLRRNTLRGYQGQNSHFIDKKIEVQEMKVFFKITQLTGSEKLTQDLGLYPD